MDKNFKNSKTLYKIKFFLLWLLFLIFLPKRTYAFVQLLAAIGSFILSVTTAVAVTSIIIILVLQLFLAALGLLNTALANLVSWSISPGAIQWSYTNPNNNPFIQTGLGITGGFVNIGLVLALVAIAFATILRLEGWDTKRLLIKLIIVGILVNFAPVICGFIVDAANIFMYYFSDRIGGIGILTTTFLNIVGNIIRAFVGIPVLQQVTTVVISLIQLIFQLYLAFVLLAFFIAFIFRYVAIWLSVILAPIAFICWILPATQRYWDWWWKNFLQWTLMGPIAAFFLYLGAAMAGQISGVMVNPFTGAGFQTLNQIIPYILPIGFLNLGIVLGIQGAGHGATFLMKWVTAGASFAVGSKLAKRVIGRGMEGVTNITGKAANWAQRLEQRASQAKGFGGKTAAWLATGLSRGTQLGSGLTSRYFLPYVARTRKLEIPKSFDEATTEEKERIVRGFLSSSDRIQLLAHMAKTGDLGKTSEKFKDEMVKEIALATRNPATRQRLNKDINDIYDVLFDKITAETKINLEDTPAKQQQMKHKINERAKEIQDEVAKNPEFADEITAYMKTTGKTIHDIAAGAIHFEQLRTGDMAKISAGSLSTIEARLGMRKSDPQKLQAVIHNFDYATAQQLLDRPGGLNHTLSVAKTSEEKIALLAKFQKENPYLLQHLFMSEAGRNINFAGRDTIQSHFGNYKNFRQGLEEGAYVVQKLESIKTLDRELASIQSKINQAMQQGQASRAKAIALNFQDLEKRAKEIINATQNVDLIKEAYDKLTQKTLTPGSGFRKGEIYRTALIIKTELNDRYKKLTGKSLY